MVVACLLGKEVEATIVNSLPSKTRQLVFLWSMAGLPWGRGVSMATPFLVSVQKELRGGGDNGIIQVDIGILPHLDKKS